VHLRLRLPRSLFPSDLPAKQLYSVTFKVLKTVKMSLPAFWAVTPCGLVGRYQLFKPEDGGSVTLRHCALCPQVHKALQQKIHTVALYAFIIHSEKLYPADISLVSPWYMFSEPNVFLLETRRCNRLKYWNLSAKFSLHLCWWITNRWYWNRTS
jgi:hypothetical protein